MKLSKRPANAVKPVRKLKAPMVALITLMTAAAVLSANSASVEAGELVESIGRLEELAPPLPPGNDQPSFSIPAKEPITHKPNLFVKALTERCSKQSAATVRAGDGSFNWRNLPLIFWQAGSSESADKRSSTFYSEINRWAADEVYIAFVDGKSGPFVSSELQTQWDFAKSKFDVLESNEKRVFRDVLLSDNWFLHSQRIDDAFTSAASLKASLVLRKFSNGWLNRNASLGRGRVLEIPVGDWLLTVSFVEQVIERCAQQKGSCGDAHILIFRVVDLATFTASNFPYTDRNAAAFEFIRGIASEAPELIRKKRNVASCFGDDYANSLTRRLEMIRWVAAR